MYMYEELREMPDSQHFFKKYIFSTAIMVFLPGWEVPSTRRALDIPGGMGGGGPSESVHTRKATGHSL